MYWIPAYLALTCDVGVLVVYVFVVRQNEAGNWGNKLGFSQYMLDFSLIAITRIIFFLPYVWKLNTPFHRYNWKCPFAWLVLQSTIIGLRAQILEWDSTIPSHTSGAWCIIYLSIASVFFQLIVVRMMLIIPVPETLEFHR